jgi:hypothetical protein
MPAVARVRADLAPSLAPSLQMTATMNEFDYQRAVAACERQLRQLEADRERLQRQAENLQHADRTLPARPGSNQLERRAGVRRWMDGPWSTPFAWTRRTT